MVWEHLSVNKPHLVYIILGGFTSLFMLCSSFIKERMYIGEATVATICGVIFGPHAADLIDPSTWGNVDQITLEFSRIVLVVQCFAVGVELPKYYMEKHWRSVTFLLIPVMTFGWLVTSLFIWWMIPTLDWLQSLCVAACVTATDPVLASSVVGKGKFAKRVPKHLRDLLSAESGCNDGMAFPFIYLALYIIQYRSEAKEAAFHWVVITILYECVFGAVYGFLIGYIGRHGIKYAEKHDLVDRESFLVFYFVLALFCAGSGSIIGVDDLLVGFAAGVGFSNDGWFTQKTEESHVSNVIDLLINLAYFVYLGTIIPWDQFNSPDLGTTPWRLVVIALFVIFFRRIPIMMALKPLIPDIKTWREALFAGHFGPIGVGAIFVAILARAELETGSTTPLSELPPAGSEEFHLISLIWPITVFLVVASIIVHGSSIAVFTLGKHINTLTLTMSYTTANEDGPSWMNRLPRIASQSKSMSKGLDTDMDDPKLENVPPGTLPPVGVAGVFLRRQKEEDNPSRQSSRAPSITRRKKKKGKWDGYGPGGPISQSAITPQRSSHSENTSVTLTPEHSESQSNEEENEKDLGEIQDDPEMHEVMHRNSDYEQDQHKSDAERNPEGREVYDEGDHIIVENEDGDVVTVQKTPDRQDNKGEASRTRKAAEGATDADTKVTPEGGKLSAGILKKLGAWRHRDDPEWESPGKSGKSKEHERKRGPALAYQFGNTIIVEDEDGEVVKKYELPQRNDRRASIAGEGGAAKPSRVGAWAGRKDDTDNADVPAAMIRQGLNRMGTWSGFGGKKEGQDGEGAVKRTQAEDDDDDDDRRIRFTIGGAGRRMTKEDFLKEIQSLDPKARCEIIAESDAPLAMKDMARKDASDDSPGSSRLFGAKATKIGASTKEMKDVGAAMARQRGADVDEEDSDSSVSESADENDTAGKGLAGVVQLARGRDRETKPNTMPNTSTTTRMSKVVSPSTQVPETAAERRRREQVLKGVDDSEGSSSLNKDSAPRDTPADRRRREAIASGRLAASNAPSGSSSAVPQSETAAEKRRREAAFGMGGESDEDSDDDNTARVPQASQRRGIRFAEEPIRGRK